MCKFTIRVYCEKRLFVVIIWTGKENPLTYILRNVTRGYKILQWNDTRFMQLQNAQQNQTENFHTPQIIHIITNVQQNRADRNLSAHNKTNAAHQQQ